jgi:hypothetical protein
MTILFGIDYITPKNYENNQPLTHLHHTFTLAGKVDVGEDDGQATYSRER